MTAESTPLRADARRNRERLLAATREVLASRGTEASMDEIARTAGLGSGTLYRHFPHLDELLAAVMTDVLTAITADLHDAAEISDPGEALRVGMQALAGRIAADRAIRDVLLQNVQHHRIERTPELIAAHAQTMELLDDLARRAQHAHVLRTDITATDLPPLLGTVGSIRVPDAPDDLWERYLDLLLDGLAPQVATPLRHQPPPRPTCPTHPTPIPHRS